MRLIDATMVEELLAVHSKNSGDANRKSGIDEARNVIQMMQTVDAVEVIRCKNCKWWDKDKDSIKGTCQLTQANPSGEWYCGNGKRN